MIFLFAINPASGGTEKTVWEESIQQYFAGSSHTVHQFYFDGKTDEELLHQQIDQHHPDCVVAVGGDGTLKIVATVLMGTTMLLGVLPAGSANGMARELGIPPDPEGSLSLLVNGTPKATDVLLINDKDICLHMSDIGLNAQLVKHYQENNFRGKLGYLRSVVQVLHKRRLLRVSVTVGDECIQRAALMVVLANARMYGTGAIINPDGNPFDGRFEVVIFRRFSFWSVLKMFWRYKAFDPKHIEIYPATSIDIETYRRAYFQIDGEYRGRITTLKAKVQPGAVQILLPT